MYLSMYLFVYFILFYFLSLYLYFYLLKFIYAYFYSFTYLSLNLFSCLINLFTLFYISQLIPITITFFSQKSFQYFMLIIIKVFGK